MKLWIRSPRTDLAYAGLLLGALLLATCASALGGCALGADARPHFRFASSDRTFLIHIQSFSLETGVLRAMDHRHNIEWEMRCTLPAQQWPELMAGKGLGVKMRLDGDEHGVELNMARRRPAGKWQMEWVDFDPERQVLL